MRSIPPLPPHVPIGDEGLASEAACEGTSVKMTATGMTSAAGEVSCVLYRGPDDFPNKPESIAARVVAPIRARTATCALEGVAPGRAAVSVYQDANANKTLDLRYGVVPRETIAARNNPKASRFA